ncbi:hypothetical protein SAMN00808754_2205 [Thermanaeromonas toyohensis ToBE]|uniref:Uncharacterized protein n=1 Tax=Thermanaeromonas toyohensis ToBE TaxID=698762 RepID=A0A1W1VY87_9FIRM|nr:hypothetical protein SAMN00808754_2205 [Thermanaeromonas toyohensis ToBE]
MACVDVALGKAGSPYPSGCRASSEALMRARQLGNEEPRLFQMRQAKEWG